MFLSNVSDFCENETGPAPQGKKATNMSQKAIDKLFAHIQDNNPVFLGGGKPTKLTGSTSLDTSRKKESMTPTPLFLFSTNKKRQRLSSKNNNDDFVAKRVITNINYPTHSSKHRQKPRNRSSQNVPKKKVSSNISFPANPHREKMEDEENNLKNLTQFSTGNW